MRVTAIIQARVGSTRLSKKILRKIKGKTVLEHVLNRVKAAKNIKNVIIATTLNREDLEIVKICSNLGISVYCGSEDDVLDRYYQASRIFNIEHIVRITSDCPLIDPEIIDAVVDLYFANDADYATNALLETFPDGEDVEVIKHSALKMAWENARLISEREHVTPYIKKNPHLFKIVNLEHKPSLGNKRWTLDREEDFEFIRIIYDNLYDINPLFGMEEILHFLEEHPEIEKLNNGIIRNEGYLKSLREDQKANLGN